MGGIPSAFVEPLSIVLGKLYRTADLEVAVLSATGDGLFEVWVPEGLPVRPMIFELLSRVSEAGIAERVLAELAARRPDSDELRTLLVKALPEALEQPPRPEFHLAPQRGGKTIPGLPDDAFAPGLQSNVRPHLNRLGLADWTALLADVQRRVCRIDADGQPRGTGFLVGPQAVLTAFHCVGDYAETPDRLRCLFDHIDRRNGERLREVPVALDSQGLAGWSAIPPLGHARAAMPPGQLDYALLRLAVPVGSMPLESGQPRGWFALPRGASTLKAGDPLLIVQHAGGQPMTLAMDLQSIAWPNENGTRIWYRTDTLPGCSGAPCLTMDLEPVLMHQYKDSSAGAGAELSGGVPLGLIRDKIETAAALLGD